MDKNKIIPVVLGILVIGVAAIFALSQPKNTQVKKTVSPAPTSSSVAGGQAANARIYTLAEVAAHSNAASCWSAINGDVYDLTQWIAKHPGGEGAILGICGKDGSAAFNGQHGGQSRPENILSGFKIGALK
jgi:cytochrome b involved in lipid metabolism